MMSGFQGCDNPWIVIQLRQGDAHPIRAGLVRISQGRRMPFDRWDGSKVRAAMKCSPPGRAESVSMKWCSSKLRKVGLHDMVVIERSDVLLALRMGFMP